MTKTITAVLLYATMLHVFRKDCIYYYNTTAAAAIVELHTAYCIIT